uniref:peptidylprolyl isomerase n=1 Tax=Setaria digitata TaxID=48799 RepID=A0A915PT56_9BILA
MGILWERQAVAFHSVFPKSVILNQNTRQLIEVRTAKQVPIVFDIQQQKSKENTGKLMAEFVLLEGENQRERARIQAAQARCELKPIQQAFFFPSLGPLSVGFQLVECGGPIAPRITEKVGSKDDEIKGPCRGHSTCDTHTISTPPHTERRASYCALKCELSVHFDESVSYESIPTASIKVPFRAGHCSDVVGSDTQLLGEVGKKRKLEDSIPVIEIRGEGQPMTAAQIRQLEEISNGGPLDIKIEKTWQPVDCPRAAKRKDFITFHYKAFTEANKKCDQSYGREPIRIQLGVGMIMPGLDKGMRGMCDTELRKIQVPYRLSRKRKSKVWKNIPNDEHWLSFNIEMLSVEPWSLDLQFKFLDTNNDTVLTENELVKFQQTMKKNFGKVWSNENIDYVIAARYYIRYFDIDGNGEIDLMEFRRIMERDLAAMTAVGSGRKQEGRKRDPSVAWILDFNNDGIVSIEEIDRADEVLQGEPAVLPMFTKDEL